MSTEYSFEDFFDAGTDSALNENRSFIISTEGLDGYSDAVVSDFQESIEHLNFLDAYNKVSDMNNEQKIKMLKKIKNNYNSKTIGRKNLGYSIESFIESEENVIIDFFGKIFSFIINLIKGIIGLIVTCISKFVNFIKSIFNKNKKMNFDKGQKLINSYDKSKTIAETQNCVNESTKILSEMMDWYNKPDSEKEYPHSNWAFYEREQYYKSLDLYRKIQDYHDKYGKYPDQKVEIPTNFSTSDKDLEEMLDYLKNPDKYDDAEMYAKACKNINNIMKNIYGGWSPSTESLSNHDKNEYMDQILIKTYSDIKLTIIINKLNTIFNSKNKSHYEILDNKDDFIESNILKLYFSKNIKQTAETFIKNVDDVSDKLTKDAKTYIKYINSGSYDKNTDNANFINYKQIIYKTLDTDLKDIKTMDIKELLKSFCTDLQMNQTCELLKDHSRHFNIIETNLKTVLFQIEGYNRKIDMKRVYNDDPDSGNKIKQNLIALSDNIKLLSKIFFNINSAATKRCEGLSYIEKFLLSI